MNNHAQIAIVGAGPIGLEMAIALKQAGISYLLFDKGQMAQMVLNYPPQTHFFSSPERISIAGIPIQTLDQQKCTREEYLAYLRSVVMYHQLQIHSYEEVLHIYKKKDGFELITRLGDTEVAYKVSYVIIATGSTSHPRLLDVPGEKSPHVTTTMGDPHQYFQKRVLVIGRKNSAAETALRCYHAGAKVSVSLRNDEFSDSVKHWILPELLSRIEKDEIDCYYNTEVAEILPDRVILKNNGANSLTGVPIDFVIKTIGFTADMKLCRQLNISLTSDQEGPVFNPDTMESNVPRAYTIGTITGGTQKRYLVFIENSHEHVEKVMKDLAHKLGGSILPKESPKWKAPVAKTKAPLEE